MFDAVPEPVFPEADAYPAYRAPDAPIRRESAGQIRIDQYVLAALVATGTQLVRKRSSGLSY